MYHLKHSSFNYIKLLLNSKYSLTKSHFTKHQMQYKTYFIIKPNIFFMKWGYFLHFYIKFLINDFKSGMGVGGGD